MLWDLLEFFGVGSHHGACMSAELRGGTVGSWAAHQILTQDYPGREVDLLGLFQLIGKLL